MSFSKRTGIVSDKIIQLQTVDDELRTALWNVFSVIMNRRAIRFGNLVVGDSSNGWFKFCIYELWPDFFKLNIDDLPPTPNTCMREIRTLYFQLPWYRIYDFVEFSIAIFKSFRDDTVTVYIEDTNRVLQREVAGYRIIDEIVTPISNEIEIRAVEQAQLTQGNDHVATHIKAALTLLSDKSNPDYRNSIKESISAVETLCRDMTGESTLGKSINKIEKLGLVFNQQFKEALEKLYAYTNNKETGIRHALLEPGQKPDFDEAKFMLVACSAFINYLTSKKPTLS